MLIYLVICFSTLLIITHRFPFSRGPDAGPERVLVRVSILRHRRALPFDDNPIPGPVSQSTPKSCEARCAATSGAGLTATSRGRVPDAAPLSRALEFMNSACCLGGEAERNVEIDAVALFEQRGICAVGPWIEELDSHDTTGCVEVDVEGGSELNRALDDHISLIDEKDLENVRLGVVGVKSHPQSLHPHCDDGLARLVNHNHHLRLSNGDSDSPIPSLIVSSRPAGRKFLEQPRFGDARMSSTDPPQAIPSVPSQFHLATLSTWLTTVGARAGRSRAGPPPNRRRSDPACAKFITYLPSPSGPPRTAARGRPQVVPDGGAGGLDVVRKFLTHGRRTAGERSGSATESRGRRQPGVKS
jgi:hypothetical protein